jgi:uncharacterized protein (DUF697 family)
MTQKVNDEALSALVRRYSLISTGEMIAIPVPVVDVAAVFLTWAKMVQDIGRLYNRELSLQDAKTLAWVFVRHALSAGGAWFGSAIIAQAILKAIPVGGTITAYLLDATIAGASIGRITRALAEEAKNHFEVVTDEEKTKKSRAFNDILTQVVSAGQSIAAIINGLRRR